MSSPEASSTAPIPRCGRGPPETDSASCRSAICALTREPIFWWTPSVGSQARTRTCGWIWSARRFDGRQVREWLEAPPGPERITWHGLLTGADLDRVFASADLFVFASVAPYESFGQVIVQAMMWGLPIVLSDWRANREVAGPGMDGVLFSVTDPSRRADRLAEALRQAAAQRRANPKWGAANRATFEKRYRRTSGRNGYTAFAASILGRRQSPE